MKCRPPSNRNPEPDEIMACEPFLIKQLQAIKPKIIIGLGNIAVKTLLKTKQGITSLRGTLDDLSGHSAHAHVPPGIPAENSG